MSHDKKKIDVHFDTLLTYFENLRPEKTIFETPSFTSNGNPSEKQSLSILQNENSNPISSILQN